MVGSPHIPRLSDLIIPFGVAAAAWNIVGINDFGLERMGSGFRVSLFIGPEIDRAAVLLLLTRTQTLAKEIAEDNR